MFKAWQSPWLMHWFMAGCLESPLACGLSRAFSSWPSIRSVERDGVAGHWPLDRLQVSDRWSSFLFFNSYWFRRGLFFQSKHIISATNFATCQCYWLRHTCVLCGNQTLGVPFYAFCLSYISGVYLFIYIYESHALTLALDCRGGGFVSLQNLLFFAHKFPVCHPSLSYFPGTNSWYFSYSEYFPALCMTLSCRLCVQWLRLLSRLSRKMNSSGIKILLVSGRWRMGCLMEVFEILTEVGNYCRNHFVDCYTSKRERGPHGNIHLLWLVSIFRSCSSKCLILKQVNLFKPFSFFHVKSPFSAQFCIMCDRLELI